MRQAELERLNVGGAGRPGPGARLAAARKLWGLSQEQVATTLHLPQRTVDAIEREDDEGLPAAAFVRGYVSGYARLVGLDADGLLADCRMRGCGAAGLSARRSLSLRRNATQRWFKRGGYAALGLFVLAVLVYWVDQAPELASAPAVAALAAPALPDGNTELEVAAPGIESVEPDERPLIRSLAPLIVEPETVQVAVEPELSVAPAVADAAAASSGQLPVEGNDSASPLPDWAVLELVFDADSWVAVLDAMGNRIAWETVKAGSSKRLSGPPPLKVVLGDAASVHVTYAGEPFDPAPYLNGRMARFSVE